MIQYSNHYSFEKTDAGGQKYFKIMVKLAQTMIHITNIIYELPEQSNAEVDISTDMTPNEFRRYKYEELLALGIRAKIQLIYRSDEKDKEKNT